MIFDSLKNSALYYPVSPRLEKAFGFIRFDRLGNDGAGDP